MRSAHFCAVRDKQLPTKERLGKTGGRDRCRMRSALVAAFAAFVVLGVSGAALANIPAPVKPAAPNVAVPVTAVPSVAHTSPNQDLLNSALNKRNRCLENPCAPGDSSKVCARKKLAPSTACQAAFLTDIAALGNIFPQITQVRPWKVKPGETVTITGKNFLAAPRWPVSVLFYSPSPKNIPFGESPYLGVKVAVRPSSDTLLQFQAPPDIPLMSAPVVETAISQSSISVTISAVYPPMTPVPTLQAAPIRVERGCQMRLLVKGIKPGDTMLQGEGSTVMYRRVGAPVFGEITNILLQHSIEDKPGPARLALAFIRQENGVITQSSPLVVDMTITTKPEAAIVPSTASVCRGGAVVVKLTAPFVPYCQGEAGGGVFAVGQFQSAGSSQSVETRVMASAPDVPDANKFLCYFSTPARDQIQCLIPRDTTATGLALSFFDARTSVLSSRYPVDRLMGGMHVEIQK